MLNKFQNKSAAAINTKPVNSDVHPCTSLNLTLIHTIIIIESSTQRCISSPDSSVERAVVPQNTRNLFKHSRVIV